MGCGCAVLLSLVIGGLIWALNYFASAGVQIPSDYVLGPDTTAFIHIAPAADDEPTRALILSLIETLASLDPESIDAEQQPLLQQLAESLQDADLEAASEFFDFFPNSFTMALEADPTAPDEYAEVASLNLSAGPRLVRWFVERIAPEHGVEHEHGEHTIFEFTPDEAELAKDVPPTFVAFQHDSLILATSLELLGRTLDRTDFDETPGEPPASPLRQELTDLSSRWLISAAAGGDTPIPPGLLTYLFEDLVQTDLGLSTDGPDWLDVPMQAFELGCGLTGTDLTLRVAFAGLDDQSGARVQEGLEQLFGGLEGELGDQELELSHEILAGEGNVVLNARLADFREWLNQKLRALADSDFPDPV
jgi:hypothetical protein